MATPLSWYDDLPVLGKLPRLQAVAKLRDVGEDEDAAALESAGSGVDHPPDVDRFADGNTWWPFRDRAWQHTAHAFGFVASRLVTGESLPIRHAGDIVGDAALKSKRIKITLDRLRVAAYPGSGTHRVLFDFYAQNQVPGGVEHLHFNATFRAREGEQAAIVGYPLFVGLNVGPEGVAFKCFTVNVKNDEDEAFLGFLESDVFRAGLKLATTAQPAIAPLSEGALNLTKFIARRHRNVPVQDFYLGLDFSDVPMRARLAEGSYIAVQIPETLQTIWDWREWIYQPSTGQIVNHASPRDLIPYNYLVFSISRYEGE